MPISPIQFGTSPTQQVTLDKIAERVKTYVEETEQGLSNPAMAQFLATCAVAAGAPGTVVINNITPPLKPAGWIG